MNRLLKKLNRLLPALSVIALAVTGGALPSASADQAAHLSDIDQGGGAVFRTYDAVTDSYLTADSGDRNLITYYERRQYPGSPPYIPHKIETSFAVDAENCISCHGKGGFNPRLGKFVPLTPHPEHELCRQCHVPKVNDELFVENSWLSIAPLRLGRSHLPGGPPSIPHSLQMRGNCIACHTGPGAVVEIRVEHSNRGNCRQCHVPVVSTSPLQIYKRESHIGK